MNELSKRLIAVVNFSEYKYRKKIDPCYLAVIWFVEKRGFSKFSTQRAVLRCLTTKVNLRLLNPDTFISEVVN